MSEIIEGTVKVIVDDCFKAGYDKGYQQGRADAIEEFLKKEKECQQNGEECPYMHSEISCVECIAENLKEQKND